MNSIPGTVTYAALERFLLQLGFVEGPSKRNYELFTHPSPHVLIVLPSHHAPDPVDDAHLLAVRKHVLENGLLDEAAFDALLRGSEPTAAAQ
jgi:hypothetical protein